MAVTEFRKEIAILKSCRDVNIVSFQVMQRFFRLPALRIKMRQSLMWCGCSAGSVGES